MREFKEFLLYLWQLPQNIVALFILLWHKLFLSKRFLYSADYIINDKQTNDVVYVYKTKNSSSKIKGFSLGNKVFIYYDENYKDQNKLMLKIVQTIKHEYKHCIQSKRLGWAYLIVIALFDLLFQGVSNNLSEKAWTETMFNKYWEKLNIKWDYNN